MRHLTPLEALVFPPVEWVIRTFHDWCPQRHPGSQKAPLGGTWEAVQGGGLSYLAPHFPELWEPDTRFWGLQLHGVATHCPSLCAVQ